MSDFGTKELARRLERQLESAQQITHMGSWEWDVATNVVTWSDELYRIYGLEPRICEITFESFLARVHPDDRARTTAAVTKALETGGRFSYPERIVRPDGSIRELETLGEAVRGPNGELLGLIGTCRDVTDERARDETIRIYADIVRHMQIGLGVFEVGDANDASTIRLVAFNPAAESIARMPLGDSVGKSLADIAPYARGGELENLIVGIARHGGVREAIVLRSRDARDPTRALAMRAFVLPGKRVGVSIEDITERTRAQRLREGERRVLEQIASGDPLPDVLETLVRAIEEHSPPTIGSILLLDADGTHVRHGAAPSLPADYVTAIDGAPIGPAAGSCGTAAYLKKPVFVEDVEKDERWADYRDVARRAGLRACWSMPILATDGRVLGTFALYYREPRSPRSEDVQLIERASDVAGIAIERRQLEDRMRALSAHVESVREDERTGIAREIHDELGQALTALRIDLAWIARRASSDDPIPRDAVLEKLRAMTEMTDGVIQQVRRISAQLRPGVLDDLGLVAAVEWQAHEFEKRTGTACVVDANLDDAPLDPAISTAIFRIFQEALTNVARHAEASRVEVKLARAHGSIRLEVHDDGRGITPEAAASPKAFGLLGIRERARQLGGTATIRGAPSEGTTIVLDVPLHAAGAS